MMDLDSQPQTYEGLKDNRAHRVMILQFLDLRDHRGILVMMVRTVLLE